jgi:hypothetical protein
MMATMGAREFWPVVEAMQSCLRAYHFPGSSRRHVTPKPLPTHFLLEARNEPISVLH